MADKTPLSDDLLNGALAIADFLGIPARRVYYIADRGYLPIFRIGKTLTARKSELDRAHSKEQLRSSDEPQEV